MNYTAPQTDISLRSASSAQLTAAHKSKPSATASNYSTAFTRKRYLLRSMLVPGCQWLADWDRIMVSDRTQLFTADKAQALQFVSPDAAATRCILIMQTVRDPQLADLCIEEVEL